MRSLRRRLRGLELIDGLGQRHRIEHIGDRARGRRHLALGQRGQPKAEPRLGRGVQFGGHGAGGKHGQRKGNRCEEFHE